MLLMLHTRSRAATTIQSAWRGWRQRQAFLPVWQQYLEEKSALVLQRVRGDGDSSRWRVACVASTCPGYAAAQKLRVFMVCSLDSLANAEGMS
jgi:hypothetical protein